MTVHRARRLWQRYEPIHAITYFDSRSAQAAVNAGLKGFWMGYFGFRAAPMGRVSAGVVQATFANFAPSRVHRALPDAWSLADPADLVIARRVAAATTLRALDDQVEVAAEQTNGLLESMIAAADPLARPLFVANAALELPDDPVERLWQNCTTLREHRGDGHVVALAAEHITGPQAHLLIIAEQGLDEEMFLKARGFDGETWESAKASLTAAGLVVDGRLTDAGLALRRHVEQRTDELADDALEAIGPADFDVVLETLERTARVIQKSRVIPPSNPIGLPPL